MGFCWRMVPSYTRRDPFRKRGEAIFECEGLIEYFFFLFFSFKVLVNFGKFAGKEYKVSIIENEGNEELLNNLFFRRIIISLLRKWNFLITSSTPILQHHPRLINDSMN